MVKEVSYEGKDSRSALLDMVEWLGYSRSVALYRYLRLLRSWYDQYQDDAALIHCLKTVVLSLEIVGGVSGYPVRVLLRKFFPEHSV